MRHILSTTLSKPLPIFTHATEHNGLIFTSCIQGFSPDSFELSADVAEEALQMFKNLAIILKESGSDMDHILKMTIFFSHLDRDFFIVNKVIDEVFSKKPPARSSIGVAELPRGCKVVVECVAAIL